ncbi:MAG: hypothetical protein NTW87_18400, partial [Planctomycetota bacterium]|nr:hypothetical protein [Planctomycetota bacterium]
VCFNQFHDTLGGTCIPSAYEQVSAQLGLATVIADHSVHKGLRRMMNALPDDLRQRIVFFNASDEAYEGYTHVEPWLDWMKWASAWRLLDEQGQFVQSQIMQAEACCNGLMRILVRLSVPAGETRILTIDKAVGEPTLVASKIKAAPARIESRGVAANLGAPGAMEFGELRLPLPRLELLEDLTDTWSHGIERYAEGPGETAHWDAPLLADAGPVMASLIQHGGIGRSALTAEYRVYAEERFVELRLRVHWAERHRLLKLVLPLDGIARRWDGVMGGELARPCDGRERPLRDRTLLETADGTRLGIVCPDVFALDATDRRVRLTLLRSPLMAHHEPHAGTAARFTVADQGAHDFRFQFYYGKEVQGRHLDRQALMYQRPLVTADLTRGMPARRDV